MSERSRPARRGLGTRAVHGDAEGATGAMSPPIVHSATFSFPTLAALLAERDLQEAGSFYQRTGHPTLRACEERLAGLEEAETALLFSSGMAAITGVFLAHLGTGQHVVALRQCYGGTLEALRWGAEHLGWEYDLVDAREPDSWGRALRDETRILHVESPTNPTLCVIDLAAAAALAHGRGALLTVDNTVASPAGQHPLASGADLVVYSATKSIGGHGDLLAGAVLGAREALRTVWKVRTVFGAVPDPTTAWLIERSLKTLPLRVERANANALELARRLRRHPGVANVFYPGLDGHAGREAACRQMSRGHGPLLSFEVRGGAAAADAAVDGLRLVRHAASLGGVESLACLPRHTSHRHLSPEQRALAGIPEGLVRLSVGIEDVDDLWADLERALAGAGERLGRPGAAC